MVRSNSRERSAGVEMGKVGGRAYGEHVAHEVVFVIASHGHVVPGFPRKTLVCTPCMSEML